MGWLIGHMGKFMHDHTGIVADVDVQTQCGTSCEYSRVGVGARCSQIKGVGGCGGGEEPRIYVCF